MKTNNKINAYILRITTTVLLFSCVIIAICSAINLPEPAPKVLPAYKSADAASNDGKFLIWSVNSIGGGGSAARESSGTPTPTPTCTASGLLIVASQTSEIYDYAELDDTVLYSFAQSQTAPNQFAVFQTHDPWGLTHLTDHITADGYTYTRFTPDHLTGFNFADYRVVVLDWSDTITNDFIGPYTAAVPALETYITDGGVVWIEGAIQDGGFPLPFGGTATYNTLNDNFIVDTSSPMIQGMPNPFEGDAASHAVFTGYPGNAHVVVVGGACPGGPTTLYELRPACATRPGTTPTGSPTSTPTPTPTCSPLLFENFDGVTPPNLPAGWTATQGINQGGFPFWVTSNSGLPSPPADSPPNAAYSIDADNLLDNRLESVTFTYSTGAQLSFRQNYAFEQQDNTTAYDCGILEISFDNGNTYQEIIAAGASFVVGGYNHTAISTDFMNPCMQQYGGGQANWSGSSCSFLTTTVNLPDAGVDQQVKIRWRMCSDNGAGRDGWRVDNVSVSGICASPTPTPSPSPTTTATATPTATATATATPTATITSSPTPTPIASSTPRPTPTPRSRPTPAPRP